MEGVQEVASTSGCFQPIIADDTMPTNDFDQTYILTDLSNAAVVPNANDTYPSNLLHQSEQAFVPNPQDDLITVPTIDNCQTSTADQNKDNDNSTVSPSFTYDVPVCSSELPKNTASEDNNLLAEEKLNKQNDTSVKSVEPAPKKLKKVLKLPFPLPKGIKKIKNLIAIYHCKVCGFLAKSKELMDEHAKEHKKEDVETKPSKKVKRKRKVKKEKGKKVKAEGGVKKEKAIKKEKGIKKEKSDNEPKKKRAPRKPKEEILVENGNVHCPECTFFTKNMQSLKVHRLMHLKDRPYKCTVCDFHGKDLKELIRHHDGGHSPGVFVCKDCGYITNERSRFDRHRERHTGHLPYRCTVCPYKTMLKAAHKVHMETHGIQI